MTTTNSSHDQTAAGRTVRDIIEHQPAQVNEVWCRKILRQLLQSLETQYTDGAAHRLIMPDTIVIQPSGDAVLLPDPDANPDFQPEIAADLRALAAVIHYAITHEMPAAGPLMGRGLEGYSDSLLNAIDRCMSPNKSLRPQTVAALRDLLGMVSLGLLKQSTAVPATVPALPVQPVPATAPAVARPVDLGPPASGRKWLWIGLAAVLLGGALYIVREHGAEKLVGAPVQPARTAAPVPPPPPLADPAPAEAPAAPAPDSAAPAAAPAAQPEASAPAMPATPERSSQADAATTAGTASYRLMIKPWGNIYVDGQRRGVSPPLKRLVLPAGPHTVMLENPGYPDQIVQLNSTRGGSGQIAHDFLAAPADSPATAPAN